MATAATIVGTQVGGSVTQATSQPGWPGSVPYTFRGLTLSVPGSWSINAMRCGTPTKNTVIVPEPVLACLYTGQPHVSFVRFGTRPTPLPNATTRHVTIDGRRATWLTGRSTGEHVVVLRVPSLDATARIQSPHRGVVDRIARSARIVAVDANGCVVNRRDLVTLPTGRPPARSGARDKLVPGTPTRIAVCRYEDGTVEQSSVTGARATRLAGRLNALPAGLSAAYPADYVPSVCVNERRHPSGYTVIATYESGPPVTVWVRIGTYRLLGASNGARTGQRTSGLVHAVTKVAGGPLGGWPMYVHRTR